MDASFGSRLDSPPDRPLPDRPTLGDRSGLMANQRTRSGTATQAEPTGKTRGDYMLQTGDGTYDSDVDGDDEFERSGAGITSPHGLEHFDGGDSDHHSESDEEASVVEGEDTPTTQGWTDGDGRSPTGNIKHWTLEQVADYMIALSPNLKQYTPAFAENAVTGDALVELHHDDLRELGMNSVGHRLTLLKAVYEQKVRAGVKIEEHHYVPLSAEDDSNELSATQDDIARVIESIRLRDQRILAAEAELREMKRDLDRISEENRKLREETLPIMRLVKDQSTPLPDPSGGSIPSPREERDGSKSAGLSRKFSTKKLWLGGAPKQPSPTHPPQTQREVRDDSTPYLEASAAAMAASSHLTASMTSQASPNSVVGQQYSPTSPAYSSHAPSSGGSYQHPGSAAQRSFPRDTSSRHDQRGYSHAEDSSTSRPNTATWSQTSTLVGDGASVRTSDRRRQPMPSPRDEDGSGSRDRENPQVEIFKSFRVSIDDPCRVVLPVALKRYNITDDWRQYALYIVHGDQERCLGLEEKPLSLFKQLEKEGRKPMFMLRRHAAPQEGWSNSSTLTVGSTGQDDRAKQIPGGVL